MSDSYWNARGCGLDCFFWSLLFSAFRGQMPPLAPRTLIITEFILLKKRKSNLFVQKLYFTQKIASNLPKPKTIETKDALI